MFKTFYRLPKKKQKRFDEGGKRLKKRNNKKKPFFSIITVVYNSEKYLEETLKVFLINHLKILSILLLMGVLVMGHKIIKKYENKIDYWVIRKTRVFMMPLIKA